MRDNIQGRHDAVDVIPHLFRLVHAENKGAAWGILSDAEWRIPFFVVTTLIAFIVIGVYFYRLDEDDRIQGVGLSLILGGALGNFVDRIRFQSVTDYVELYIGTGPIKDLLISTVGYYRWPAFNIADMAIVSGILLILYYIFFIEPKILKAKAEGREAHAQEGV